MARILGHDVVIAAELETVVKSLELRLKKVETEIRIFIISGILYLAIATLHYFTQ